jgi:hypothetical protein
MKLGAIDPIIFETVEPAASDANTQVIWCCFGNASRVNYANKRAEMWGAVKDRLPYLALPNSVDLRDQLIGPEFKFNLKGEIQLEKKEDMRKRGLASPDIADALALTFARHVFPRAYNDFTGRGDHLVVSDYNPWSREAMEGLPLRKRWGDTMPKAGRG